ncbi:MAG: DUF4469 domain-containing protein [Treponema sp.]|jgi:hypothetical protein|nr:DUF4469 domain-containing protein [Treponema sp.]
MAIDFVVKDLIHKIIAKFIHAYLPGAKKPYYLKAVFETKLDIHGLASKADVYNIETNPKVIEEGLEAACRLIYYLTADGYQIDIPIFNTKVRLPGEYEGAEIGLAEGMKPAIRMRPAKEFREYIERNVQVLIDGIEGENGLIAEALDEKTGEIDEGATIGNVLTIRGYGLKIESDAAHEAQMGVFFQPSSGLPLKAEVVPVNEPKTLKVIVPATLTAGTEYFLRIFTMSSAHGGGKPLKEVRDMKSDFKVTAQQ